MAADHARSIARLGRRRTHPMRPAGSPLSWGRAGDLPLACLRASRLLCPPGSCRFYLSGPWPVSSPAECDGLARDSRGETMKYSWTTARAMMLATVLARQISAARA